MKSTFSMINVLVAVLSVSAISAACGHAATIPIATPTYIPVYTPTPSPTSTFTPSRTPTKTPTLTPTPILAPVIQDTFLYSGPGSDGYEKLVNLPVGTNLEPLGEFEDFVLVRLIGADSPREGYVPVTMLAKVPPYLPIIPVEKLPWKVFMSMASPAKPIEEQNSTENWVGTTLAHGIRFTDGLQIKLNLESLNGSNGIVFQGTGEGVPWWSGQKRIEFFYADGNLQILLRDGTQEAVIYDSNLPLKIINGATTGEITITLDQFGKSIQISQDNTDIFQLTFASVGDFPNGLFPNGQILTITLTTGPKATGRLTELVFAAPPDGKYKK